MEQEQEYDGDSIYSGIIHSRRELAKSSLVADRFACGRLIVKTRSCLIYQGWDTVSGDAVVLKTLYDSPSQQQILAFQQEGSLLRQTLHKGLLKGPGYFLWKQQHWLVMGPAGGSLLLDLLSSGKTEQWKGSLRRQVVSNIALALDWLHKKGWEHGDIKPDNIFVEPATGQVTLIDYSSTRKLGTSRSEQPFSSEWQHPDITLNSVDTLADCYGLALLIWCLWTGQHPFAESGRVRFDQPPAFWPWQNGCWHHGYWLRSCLKDPGRFTLPELERRFGLGLLTI